MKRFLAFMMAAMMLLAAVPVEALAATETVPKENYIINTSTYMTRLRTNYDKEAEFELGFKVRVDGEQFDRFTASMGEGLMTAGHIRVDNGKDRTFEEAGMKFATAKSKSSFLTHNKEFIKEFYEKDSFTVTVTTPEGYEIVAEGIENQMLPEERQAFKESLGESLPEEDTQKYHVDPNYTFLKDQYGSKVLRIDIKEFANGSDPAKKAFLETATISINGQNYGSMKALGFTITNYYGFELTDLTKISKVILNDELKCLIKNGNDQINFTIKNELSVEDRQAIAGSEVEPEPETETAKIYDITAKLVKSDDQSTESMSGATMKHEAQMIEDKDGNIVVLLHFAPAEIMGILAYATDLKLKDAISTDFVMQEDNSAIAIIKLPGFTQNEKVFQGHIYSSVMDSDVALKLTKSENSKDLATVLSDRVSAVEKMLKDNKYYENTLTPVQEALETAKKPTDLIEAYTGLEKAVAGLRKVVDNPFEGDTVFHVQVKDTSIIGSKSLAKYAKIEKKNGKNVMTVQYNRYLEWSGEVYMESVQIFDKEGKEIPSTYKLDKYKTGTLSFEMPYVPASGIFDVKLTIGNGQGTKESEIQMDLSTIKKGPFRELLTEAINEYGYFTGADWQTREPMENRKDDLTEASWKTFSTALEKAKADLISDSLTQEQIEEDIKALKEARFHLVYKIQAGEGNTANKGISGLNKPAGSYYKDPEAEYPEHVGWAGSKVVFGKEGAVYRVLDISDNGQVLLMSEDLRVKKPFTSSQTDKKVRWSTSLLRQYMNHDFYNSAFSDVEKAAIVKTKNETIDYEDGYLGPPAVVPDTKVVTEDFIFAPDMKMVSNDAYGYGSKDSRMVSKDYALRNIFIDAWSEELAILGVQPKGRIAGTFVASSKNLEAPVCMNIDSNDILMTVDAKTGIPKGMTASEKLDSNLWKFVMKDDSLKLADSYDAKLKGNKVSTDLGIYNGKVMAVIIEGDDFATGTIKSYGMVDPKGFKVPAFDSSKEKIYVIAIKDEDGKTAYASEPAVLKVEGKVAPEEGNQPGIPDPQKPYEVTVQMNQKGKQNPSMCDPMFAEKADLEAQGENILMKLYVANPVPGFPEQGADGTLKDFRVTYKGTDYIAESDITSKPLMEVKADNPLFGLKKGDKIPAQVLKITLPREALNESKLDVTCFVNVVMNSEAKFDMALSNANIPQKPVDPDTQKPVDPDTQKPAEKLDIKNLKDGVYVIDGNMVKTDKKSASMSDNAINHKIKLTVKNGEYFLTMNFKGMKIGNKAGYLKSMKYFKDGYTENQFGAPQGAVGEVTVDAYQLNSDGSKVSDEYGTDYMKTVTFPMIESAKENGFVPLEVFVPVMESIAKGQGMQKVYLSLNEETLAKADDESSFVDPKGDGPVEVDPAKKDNMIDGIKTPKTGDQYSLELYAFALAAAALCAAGMMTRKRR